MMDSHFRKKTRTVSVQDNCIFCSFQFFTLIQKKTVYGMIKQYMLCLNAVGYQNRIAFTILNTYV